MIKILLAVFIFLYLVPSTLSQTVVQVDSLFKSNEMSVGWEFFEENRKIKQLEVLEKVTDWNNKKSIPIAFGKDVKAVWLRTTLFNSSNALLPIRILTKGIDSLNVLWKDNQGKLNSYYTGRNISLSKRFAASQYLVIPVTLEPKENTTIYVRIYNEAYHLSLPFLMIANPSETNLIIKKGEVFYTSYLGSLFLMMIFSVVLFSFYQERLYLFYFFCLVFSFSIAFCYNDFTFVYFSTLPDFIKNKNAFAVFISLSNISYLLLAEQYLNVDRKKASTIIIVSRISIMILILLLIGFVGSGKTLYYYRNYFYPFISINAFITYYHLIISIKKDYSPSWFFLLATAPIVLISTIDVMSDYSGIPIQTVHDYFYGGTIVEMFFLTIGIVYRFREERKKLEQSRQAIFVAEINAQDKERDRIARELHDKIGHDILQIKQFLSRTLESLKIPEKSFDLLEKKTDDLAKIYHDLIGLSHQLTTKSLNNKDLIQEISILYRNYDKPKFKLFLPEEPLNLEPFVAENLFRIITESVQNIMKHAKATEVGIDISKGNQELRLRIEDNGIGFNLTQTKSEGIGLKNLKFRAEIELKGKLIIESSPGNGTIILLKIALKNDRTTTLHRLIERGNHWRFTLRRFIGRNLRQANK